MAVCGEVCIRYADVRKPFVLDITIEYHRLDVPFVVLVNPDALEAEADLLLITQQILCFIQQLECHVLVELGPAERDLTVVRRRLSDDLLRVLSG